MLGLEWFIVMGNQCLESPPRQVEESTMDVDDYDPRKPEYISEATQEQVEKSNAELLSRQIAKLEAATLHRKERGCKVVRHYTSVVETLREKETAIMGKFGRRGKFSHARVRSEPVHVNHDEMEKLEELSKRARFDTVQEGPLAELDDDSTEAGSDDLDESAVGEEDAEPSVQSVRTLPVMKAPVHDRELFMPGASQLSSWSGSSTPSQPLCDSSQDVLLKEGI